MKKLLIFLACLLCLTLCIVSCGKNNTNGSESTGTETGDIDWTDLGSDGTSGDLDTPAHTFEIGVDTSEGWGPLTPFN